MSIRAVKITNLKGVAKFLDECLSEKANVNDQVVAGYIVGLMANDNFEKWYDEGKGDKNFVAIIDLAADLELDQGSPHWRTQKWNLLESHIKTFVAQHR